MDCIFCKIIKGELPSYKVYEDGDYLVFLSIQPLNPGHTLVIPKNHMRWVWDSPDIGTYYEVVQKITKAIQKTFKIEMVASAVVGEEVPHAHVWLVPRFSDDGHGGAIKFDNIKDISKERMLEISQQISQNIE